MADNDNLLTQAAPAEHSKRIVFIAKALAYGCMLNFWSPKFTVYDHYEKVVENNQEKRKRVGKDWKDIASREGESRLKDYLDNIWQFRQPDVAFLELFGYVVCSERRFSEGSRGNVSLVDYIPDREYIEYMLTPKAFALLETPPVPPKIFISYKRETSSAFALLVQSRLKLNEVNEVFLDVTGLDQGIEWEKKLHDIIRESDYFVCMVASDTFKSENVAKEVEWAKEIYDDPDKSITIIPLIHPGFRRDPYINYPEWFKFLLSLNGIPVSSENPLDYASAIDRLLNRLGKVSL